MTQKEKQERVQSLIDTDYFTDNGTGEIKDMLDAENSRVMSELDIEEWEKRSRRLVR